MGFTCSVCKKTLNKKRSVECGACNGTGEVKRLFRWANCDPCRGTGSIGEYYCPSHPDAPKLFKFASLGSPKPGARLPSLRQPPTTLQPKCVTCGGTRRSRMYGVVVSCPTCLPGQWKRELPPPGYNRPGGFGPGF